MVDPVLKVENIGKVYAIKGKPVHAVSNVSFEIGPKETLALVGESGCGKSSLGRMSLFLEKPSSGKVFFDGKNLAHLSKKSLKAMRKHMQMIFQDPLSSFDPRLSMRQSLCEPLEIHGLYTAAERLQRVEQWVERVGLHPAHLSRFPAAFSGGQRQRLAIARALVLQPRLIVCDEPLSALDVSVQAQILHLLIDLQHEWDLSFLFISHQLAVVRQIAHRVAVMYRGRFVEMAETEELFSRPLHPYTQLLLQSQPRLGYQKPSFSSEIKRVLEGSCQGFYASSWREASPGHFVAENGNNP